MCNFIIRPIKSYCTVDILGFNKGKAEVIVKRGDSVLVKLVNEKDVAAEFEDGSAVSIPINTFIHSFTADPADIKKTKEEESKWFPKSEKKEAK